MKNYGEKRYRWYRYHMRFSAASYVTCYVGGHLLAEQLHIVGNDDGAESAGGETLLLLGQAPNQTEQLQNRTGTNTIYLPVTIPFLEIQILLLFSYSFVIYLVKLSKCLHLFPLFCCKYSFPLT